MTTFNIGFFGISGKLTVDNGTLSYSHPYGRAFRVRMADIQTVTVDVKGWGSCILKIVGHGTVLAEEEMTRIDAEKCQKWIWAQLESEKTPPPKKAPMATFKIGLMGLFGKLEVKDGFLSYSQLAGNSARARLADIESVAVNEKSSTESIVCLIGRGSTVAEIVVPQPYANKCQEWILAQLDSAKATPHAAEEVR